MKWTPDTITAIVIVVGCLLLLFFKIDGEVRSILSLAAGWIFGGQFHVRQITKEVNKTNA